MSIPAAFPILAFSEGWAGAACARCQTCGNPPLDLQNEAQVRTDHYKPGVAWLAVLGLCGALLLIYAGAFTTTINAGMVFSDWPLSNGSLNPHGWTENIAMMAEHSHRLLGMFVGLVTLSLAVLVWRTESRRWVRVLAFTALLAVIGQGLLGGFRVLENSTLLALIHGVMAQLVICVLVATALSCSRFWLSFSPEPADVATLRRIRRMGIALIALIVVQLIVGATVRHEGAGMAIPTFPEPFWPQDWSRAVALQYAHRVLGVLVMLQMLFFAAKALSQKAPQNGPFRFFVTASVILVFAQITLGASIIWTQRSAIVTTLHVVNGALILTMTWAAVFLLYRKPQVARASVSHAPQATPVNV